jgi:hypothetical protein
MRLSLVREPALYGAGSALPSLPPSKRQGVGASRQYAASHPSRRLSTAPTEDRNTPARAVNAEAGQLATRTIAARPLR